MEADRSWQAQVLAQFTFNGASYRLTLPHIVESLTAAGLLKRPLPGSGSWDAGLVAYCRTEIDGFRLAEEVVADYCDQLTSRGILIREPGRWRIDFAVASRAAATLKEATARRERLGETR